MTVRSHGTKAHNLALHKECPAVSGHGDLTAQCLVDEASMEEARVLISSPPITPSRPCWGRSVAPFSFERLSMPRDRAYLPQDNPELLAAWQHFPDPVLAHPTGEVLEYMGSTKTAAGWVHTFRHRCHPETGERRYWHLPATPGWAPSTAEE